MNQWVQNDAYSCLSFVSHPSVSGASATCMPTSVCLTRESWAVSVSTTRQGQTAADVRGTTMEEPGVWAPTSPYRKELLIYVGIAMPLMFCRQTLKYNHFTSDAAE